MTAFTEHDTARFTWSHDPRLGTGVLKRKSDGVEVFFQGDDCAQMVRETHRLFQKTTSPRYPNTAPTFGQVFDSIASEYFA